MKERPILFKGPLVRAILAGQKTVTRRVVKPQFQTAPVDVVDGVPSWDSPTNYAGEVQMNTQHGEPCPYGKPGDRLWVRETWARVGNCDPGYLTFAATYPGCLTPELENIPAANEIRWKPSIHMFRRDSRILLEITDVRVERLQDISRAGIRAEGLQCPPELASDDVSPNYRDWYPAAWRELWESTGGDWEANPWVWVVEFKRVTPP
ncbi:hypothetical protein PspS35_19465 [Pseudomonas sp. S35]|uniref:hypothetical protein n=1 Tax=Pseudomonas sp. S35 TaxID=1573719 RepID=UPI00132ECC53|nr:hypothetical protein [Pseudomonas sp. S35]QHF45864.1 hypothetical protein PspS35_19465 [Pseudomonas sp. S35]